MIAVVLIAGLTLLVALCVGDLIAPSLRTLTLSTLDQPWPYPASFSAIHDTVIADQQPQLAEAGGGNGGRTPQLASGSSPLPIKRLSRNSVSLLRVPVGREHGFRLIVNTDSG